MIYETKADAEAEATSFQHTECKCKMLMELLSDEVMAERSIFNAFNVFRVCSV